MKLPNIQLRKKTVLVTSVIALGLIGGGTATMANQNKAGADTSPIVTEVDNHNDKLKNHEARISNLEMDTTNLQRNTGTAAAPNKQSVPGVRATTPTQTATVSTTNNSVATVEAPTAVPVVTAYREIVIDAETSDCEYTYSDGSTKQFRFKERGADAWITDGNGQNGHAVHTTSIKGECSDRALGQLKN